MNDVTTKIDGIERHIVSSDAWRKAREEMTQKEKVHMRAGDHLAAERRRMPWMKMGQNYVFEGTHGGATLLDLFEGRRQLILYHFMFGPNVDGWPDAGCVGCSFFADQIGHLNHLNARDIAFALVSAAPIENLELYRKRMGWTVSWYSATPDFNRACDVSRETGISHGLSVFYRSGWDIYRTYFTTERGTEPFGTAWSFFDIAPLGRQERWQDVPEGSPQGEPYKWWRRHDEYAGT